MPWWLWLFPGLVVGGFTAVALMYGRGKDVTFHHYVAGEQPPAVAERTVRHVHEHHHRVYVDQPPRPYQAGTAEVVRPPRRVLPGGDRDDVA